MNRVSSFFAGILLGAVTMFVAMQFYIVRANDGFHLIPKLAAKLENPYVDIRKFTLNDWQNRRRGLERHNGVSVSWHVPLNTLIGPTRTRSQSHSRRSSALSCC